MQEGLLQPSMPPTLPFSKFMAALIQALKGEGIRPCILRNYGGFPSENLGNDVDFLILQADLPRAMRALQSTEQIRIVGYIERTFVASVFVEGVSATPEFRSLQIDFFVSLSWKELPYLPVDSVLQASAPIQLGSLCFFVPSRVHEAIISLLNSLIVGGMVKEKYLPMVRRIFVSDRSEVIADLAPQFGVKVATRLVDAVICEDRGKVIGCVRPLRTALLLRSMWHRPVRSILAAVRYYARVFKIRVSPKTVEVVSILDPTNCAKSKVGNGLLQMLEHSAKYVKQVHLGPARALENEQSDGGETRDLSLRASSRSQVSMTYVVRWFVEDWTSRLLGKSNLTLHLCEGCYHDLLIDPKRYSYRGPMWFARLVGALLPAPDLWILLDPSSDGLQPESQQAALTKTHAQLEAYRSFVKSQKRYVILNANSKAANVREGAYAAIIDTLADRAERTLENRFQRRKTST
jgi:hypothetical protein